jgi:hypothetical protein
MKTKKEIMNGIESVKRNRRVYTTAGDKTPLGLYRTIKAELAGDL